MSLASDAAGQSGGSSLVAPTAFLPAPPAVRPHDLEAGLAAQESGQLGIVPSPSHGAGTSQSQQAPRGLPSSYLRRCLRRHRSQVRYPFKFKVLVLVVSVCGIAWITNYLTVVLPTIDHYKDTPCKYNDSQLTYNAKMLFVYFLWFALARCCLFIPGIAQRVALVQSRTHGFCRTYCIHLVLRDGPLYIFAVGAMLFWFHLMQSSACEDRSPVLYEVLKQYAIYSCVFSIICLVLTYWHNKMILLSGREVHFFTVEPPGAPPGTLDKLQSFKYDEQVFGDEDGKKYPAECPICLAVWEADDVIKVTRCQHAFHEECIGHWLQAAKTCALCRQDLTKPLEEASPVATFDAAPETIGAASPVTDLEHAPTIPEPSGEVVPQPL